jgi:hypothetical protein
MKRGAYSKSVFGAKSAYPLLILVIFAFVLVSVFAYGTSNPQIFGHSAKEIDFSQGVAGNAWFKGSVEVSGDAKIGNSGAACSSSKAGTLRFNSGSNKMEYCDGASWNEIAKCPAGSQTWNTPGIYSFTPLPDCTNYTITVVGGAGANYGSPVWGTSTIGGKGGEVTFNYTTLSSDGFEILVGAKGTSNGVAVIGGGAAGDAPSDPAGGGGGGGASAIKHGTKLLAISGGGGGGSGYGSGNGGNGGGGNNGGGGASPLGSTGGSGNSGGSGGCGNYCGGSGGSNGDNGGSGSVGGGGAGHPTFLIAGGGGHGYGGGGGGGYGGGGGGGHASYSTGGGGGGGGGFVNTSVVANITTLTPTNTEHGYVIISWYA